jgi:L-asparaginase/Glu-tRNA(Gln) amidotransferase subunit D
VSAVTAPNAEFGTLRRFGGAMKTKQLEVGAKVVVSTGNGDEEDEVIRVLVDAVDAGVWIVETARNGRVIVMRGRDSQAALSS